MSEKPIIFSAPMVRAIVEGRKTETRRILKPQPEYGVGGEADWVLLDRDGDPSDSQLRCPYGRPGDRLWVRETFYCDHHFAGDYERGVGASTGQEVTRACE